mgnify:CR=1 FL=1
MRAAKAFGKVVISFAGAPAGRARQIALDAINDRKADVVARPGVLPARIPEPGHELHAYFFLASAAFSSAPSLASLPFFSSVFCSE